MRLSLQLPAIVIASLLALLLTAAPVFSQPGDDVFDTPIPTDADPADNPGSGEIAGTLEEMQAAGEILAEMQDDSDLGDLLEEARGVFIIPEYGTAALIIGAAGGEGVLLLRDNGDWDRPGFYDVGSLTAGVQAGVAAGSMALLLMSERAVDSFKEDTNFSLTLDAGFSIIDWSTRARTETGRGNDVIVWTDTEGLFAELSIGINNIIWDDAENEQFYGRSVTPSAIIDGEVLNPHADRLQQALNQ